MYRTLAPALTFLCTIAAMCITAVATVPTHLSMQGSLSDANGQPLPAGQKTFTFSIHDAESGGTEVWPGSGEIQLITTDAYGRWSALIGSVTPLTDAALNDPSRWLQIIVDDGVNPPVNLPRMKLTTGPYSYRVSTVDGASGGSITGSLTVGGGTVVLSTAKDDNSMIGGGLMAIGPGTVASGMNSFAVGDQNTASGDWSNVGGGRYNHARGAYSSISGGGGQTPGDSNHAGGFGSTVGGGWNNLAKKIGNTISGGSNNQAGNDPDFIDGGYATVGGGWLNAGNGTYSTVGGGYNNGALGYGSTASGGMDNRANDHGTTVAGGQSNEAALPWGSIGGGFDNLVQGRFSTVGGGDSNFAGFTPSDRWWCTIGGGHGNYANASAGTIGGGDRNSVSGNWGTIGGGRDNWVNTNSDYGVIGGGYSNTIGATGDINHYGTIGGGEDNYLNGDHGFIGGGYSNQIGQFQNVIGYGTIGGGYDNYVSGAHGCVPGGAFNRAGLASFACGYNAHADHVGCFVWSDGMAELNTTNDRQFLARASQGFAFHTSTGATGCYLFANANAWSPISDSSVKENRQPVDGEELLRRLAAIPVETWNYIEQGDSIRHIGPMAQDFYSAFGVGESDRHISTIDADGVALAAIQALIAQLREKDEKIEALMMRVSALERK